MKKTFGIELECFIKSKDAKSVSLDGFKKIKDLSLYTTDKSLSGIELVSDIIEESRLFNTMLQLSSFSVDYTLVHQTYSSRNRGPTGLHLHIGYSNTHEYTILDIIRMYVHAHKHRLEFLSLSDRIGNKYAVPPSSLLDKISALIYMSDIIDIESTLMSKYNAINVSRFYINALNKPTVEYRFASSSIIEDLNKISNFFNLCNENFDVIHEEHVENSVYINKLKLVYVSGILGKDIEHLVDVYFEDQKIKTVKFITNRIDLRDNKVISQDQVNNLLY